MKIYYWSSKTLKQYGNGHIIAMASSLDEAREVALLNFKKELTHLFPYIDLDNEEDNNEIEALIANFITDINQSPLPCPANSILIMGSS